jgi:uncharacterized membrane protein YphA (DoxX/SURF4 family)
VRRLFSSFAPGAPGLGLLLLRLAAGSALICRCVSALAAGGSRPPAWLHGLGVLLGVLLVGGLWTPVAAVLVVGATIFAMLSHSDPRPPLGWIGLIAACLALLGPGAWSIDAWLYGWKEIKIPARTREPGSPD